MPTSPRVSAARRVAFDILLQVETRDSFASELLHSHLLGRLSIADRALATELVMGVLRWRMTLDIALERAAKKSIAKFDIEVKTALRLGAYQLLFLDRIPARAAVNESVELAKLHRKRSAAPLVNALLRKCSADSREPAYPDTSEAISRRYSHPLWLVKRWVRKYGSETARKTCEYNQLRPRATMRFLFRDEMATETIKKELARDQIDLEPARIVTGAWNVVRGDVTQTNAYREHRLAIQDEGSQLIGLLAQGRRILDCCAAPGGKSAIAGERNPEAQVISMDLHVHRARLMRELTGSRMVLAADACRLPFAQLFDCIIADLPCTGTGTLSRNPEIKLRLQPADPCRLAKLQLEILRSVSTQARSIVYSTCSLEPEEGEEVVEQFLATHSNFHVLPIASRLELLANEKAIDPRAVGSLIQGKFLRTIPGMHRCDGFFAAILQAAEAAEASEQNRRR